MNKNNKKSIKKTKENLSSEKDLHDQHELKQDHHYIISNKEECSCKKLYTHNIFDFNYESLYVIIKNSNYMLNKLFDFNFMLYNYNCKLIKEYLKSVNLINFKEKIIKANQDL